MAETDELELGVEVAEYFVLLLAVAKYGGYLEDRLGDGASDEILREGVSLVRRIDVQDGDAIRNLFVENLNRDVSKKTVARTFIVHVSSFEQVGRRAITIRSAIARGGTAVLNALFKQARDRSAIKQSIAASKLSDAAEAFTEFASLRYRTARIKRWIKEARESVGKGVIAQNPVASAIAAVTDHVRSLKQQEAREESATESEDLQEAKDERTGELDQLQSDATEAARAALEDAGDEDAPPTKSEVIGIAAAAAAAAAARLSNTENVPAALRDLDPEQRAAALTDGVVLVSAGAGAGKSTTLVARVRYLVQERGATASRMLVSSFNKEAADELGHKIGVAIGGAKADAMMIGTLHSVFKSCINDYGSPVEKAMFPKQKWTGGKRRSDPVLSGTAIAAAVNRIWRKCFATPDGRGGFVEPEVPSARQMLMAKTRYAGNMITPAIAKAEAKSELQKQEATWYEMYEGLKGSIPGWKPECGDRPDAMYEYHSFMKRFREVRQGPSTTTVRLGDYDDMISTFVEILERDPAAKAAFQSKFDHIMVDECQDLNTVQNRALALMTEHISRDSTDKSFWMVGDDKQSIYDFRGAQPGQFTARASDPNTKLRQIRTNYRCPPEVVEAANHLISNNVNQIKMEANAAPGKSKGDASIRASIYKDEAETAIAIAGEIKASWDDGTPLSHNAILCRSNSELNAFETGLLMRGIPYARKGASSFLSAPETKGFLGYITLVTDSDTEKTQAALADVINKPNRFFLKGGPEEVKRSIDNAIHNYARKMRVPKKSVNAFEALRDYNFQVDLLRSFGTLERNFSEALETMDALVQGLGNLQEISDNEKASTKDMFDAVLQMPGIKLSYNPRAGRTVRVPTTFADELTIAAKDFSADDDDAPPESTSEGEVRLGNIGFLYELAKPDPNDPADAVLPPTTPKGFWAKMGRLTEKAKELRIDLDEWNKKQKEKPPEDRERPPGVYLGTIHSTKGAQWENVVLQMPKGRFPLVKKRKEGEETDETRAEDERKIESERRLAYVAMTRPKKNLRVVAPAEFNGRPAGLSMFVSEAGLSVGENVQRPTSGEVPKTASHFVEDYGDDNWYANAGGF